MLVVELIVGAAWLRHVWSRPQAIRAPPLAKLETLDRLAAAELKSVYQRVIDLPDAENLRKLAEVYMVNGFFAEAELCCRRAAELEPDNYDVRFLRAVAFDRLGGTEEAVEQFTVARSLAPDGFKGECSYNLGRNFLRLSNVEQAEQAFREGASSYVPAKYELARLFVAQGREMDAKPILDELLASYPRSIRVLQQRARVAEALGNLQLAAELRDRAERGEPKVASDYLVVNLLLLSQYHGLGKLLGEADRLRQQEDFHKAVQRYRQALEIRWTAKTAEKLALVEMDLGNWKQAVDLMEEVLARDGATARRLEVLGSAYVGWSKQENDQRLHDKAVALWRRATEYTGPSNVHVRLFEHYRDQGNAELRARHEATALHYKGVELFRTNKLKLAGQAFADAIRIDPDRAHSWYYVGELARAADNRNVAVRAYERCLQLEPHHGRAAAQLARLQDFERQSSAAGPQQSDKPSNGSDAN